MNGLDTPLHPIEKAILHALSDLKSVGMDELASKSSLSIDQIRRGVQWLKAKNLLEQDEQASISYSLGGEGKVVAEKGLPERRLVNLIHDSGGRVDISLASKELGSEFAAALGRSKKNGWVRIDGNKLSLTELPRKTNEEEMIERLSRGEIRSDSLSQVDLEALDKLRNWHEGLIQRNESRKVKVKISQLGLSLSPTSMEDEIDSITPEILRTREWKHKKLRPLDVTSPQPKIFPGRRHPMRLFMNEVREAFVSLGFDEIFGPMVQSALWNFDALFIPQEHSAREMQDTFYISGLHANLESFKTQTKKIKSVHETGSDTGSMGWGYKWKEDEAAKVVLRTHTTAVTVSYLSKYRPEEARVFCVGRVFRNEKTNYKHNPEFFQIEGVMVGEKLNLRNLIYILSRFYSKLGFEEIKFWPTYFPYTEPSLQTMVFLKKTNKWMELGGMGLFRPEVTRPLGVTNPVLAWGLSLDRLVMLKYGLEDIRDLFGANLDWLRKIGLGMI